MKWYKVGPVSSQDVHELIPVELPEAQTMMESSLPDNNPKSKFGVKKVPLHLVPPSAIIYMAMGFADGARKYGAYNWRSTSIAASVYYAAALRHLQAWWDGEQVASDSKLPHLAHALACLALIIEGTELGNLVDDRPIKGPAATLMEKFNEQQK